MVLSHTLNMVRRRATALDALRLCCVSASTQDLKVYHWICVVL